MRDIALARLTGGAGALPAPVDRRLGRRCVRAAKAGGLPVTAEAAPHHFTLTDAAVAAYDPVFKVNPPLRPAADVDAVKAGLADGTIDAIATDHAPHAQEDKEAAVRPGAARDARAGDGAGPGPHRARAADRAGARRCCRGSRPRIAGLDGQPRRARSPRAGPPTCASSTPPPRGWSSPTRLASRSRNTPYAGRKLTGRVRHTVLARRAGRHRRRGAAVTRTRGRCSSWPTARCSRARPSARAAGGVATGEVVFNTVLSRLPGGHHRPVLRRPGHHLHLPAHRQLRRHRRRRREPPARSAAASIVRDLARRPSNWRGDRRPRHLARAPRRARHRRRRHPPPHPPHPRGGRHALRLRHRRRGRRSRRRRRAEPGTDGIDLVAEVTTAEPYTGRRRPAARRRLRLRHQDARILRHLGELATVEVVPASTPAAEVLARKPRRRVPVQRARRPRRGHLRHRRHRAACSARCRCSASASATSCWRRRSAATTYKLPFGHHGGNHPVRRLRDGAVEITSQNHNYAVADGSVAARRRHPRQPQRRRDRGPALPRRRPPSACSTTPRPAPAPTTPATCSTSSRALMAGEAADAQARPTSQSILLIGSGPIVIGQACEFDYSGTQACRVLRSEGYRVILANSNPATIMTDPDFADRTYIEPLDARRAHRHHRAGAARRPAADARRPDRAQPGHGAAPSGACSSAFGVELIGAQRRGHPHRREPRAVQGGHDRDRPGRARRRASPTPLDEAIDGRRRDRLPGDRAAVVHPRRRRAPASPPTPTSCARIAAAGPGRQPDLARSSSSGRSRGGRSTSSRSCATAPTTAWSSARSRTSTRWACTPATRSPWRRPRRCPTSSTSACATPPSPASAASASTPAAPTSSSRSNPANGEMVVIEMNPRVSPVERAGVEGHRLPDRQDRRPPGRRLHARRDPQRHHPRDAGQLRADHRLRRHQGAPLGVREVPGHAPTCSAPGCSRSARPWPSAARSPSRCRRACARSSTAAGASTATPARPPSTTSTTTSSCAGPPSPRPTAPSSSRRRCAGASASSGCTRPRGSTRGSSTRSRRSPRSGPRLAELGFDGMTRRDWRRAKRLGFSDAQLALAAGACAEDDVRAARLAAGVRATFKTVDTCGAEFEADTPYHYSTYEDEDEVRGGERPDGRHPRLGSQPHRPGHRVRLLLRARQLRPARRRLRDGDGQLQPRDRLHRLRHQRPPLLRAAHLRGRAERRSRPSRPRAGGASCRLGGQTPLKLAGRLPAGAGARHAARVDRPGRGPRALERAVRPPRDPPARGRHRGHRRRRAARSSSASATRRWCGRRYVLGGRAMEIVYDDERPAPGHGRAGRLRLARPRGRAVGRAAGAGRPLPRGRHRGRRRRHPRRHRRGADRRGHGARRGGGRALGRQRVRDPAADAAAPRSSRSSRRYTRAIADALDVRGLLNVQYAVQAAARCSCIEANPRASRTVPFVAKATGVPLAKVAARVMVGATLAELRDEGLLRPPVTGGHVSVKEAVLPFNRFPDVDTLLGPEMRSTGEVMGIDAHVRPGLRQEPDRGRRPPAHAEGSSARRTRKREQFPARACCLAVLLS